MTHIVRLILIRTLRLVIYQGDDLIPDYEAYGAGIPCRPWPAPYPAGQFSKREFQLDLTAGQATDPAGRPSDPHHPRQDGLFFRRRL